MTVGEFHFATAFPKFDGDALCAEADPDDFFPEKGGITKDAKAICRRCGVIDECLQWALDNDERIGIWGGLSAKERALLVRARRRKAA